MNEEVPQPQHRYVLPNKPQSVVQTFPVPNLIYLNIQIIARVAYILQFYSPSLTLLPVVKTNPRDDPRNIYTYLKNKTVLQEIQACPGKVLPSLHFRRKTPTLQKVKMCDV